jgi:hypothetical protein
MKSHEKGIVLIGTLMLLFVLMALLAAFFTMTRQEIHSYQGVAKSQKGFLAAEAALNLRAEDIRDIFVGYRVPSGTSPSSTAPCEAGNDGDGDFECSSLSLNNRVVHTYLTEPAGNPTLRTIPANELYGGLTAQEYRYSVRSEAYDPNGRPEALLDLNFMSRLVPLFQFVAFYDKDLEILPGQNMTLTGPVHTNGDLYVNSDATLTINGQVSSVGRMYRGRKNDASCAGTVRVYDPSTARNLLSPCSSRTTVLSSHTSPFNGRIRLAVDDLVVPEPELLDPAVGQVYWDRADLRLVLQLDAAGNPITSASNPTNPTGIVVQNSDHTTDVAKTTSLNTCIVASGELASSRAIGTTTSFYNNRENKSIRMMEVDVRRLFRCIQSGNLFGGAKTLGDTSDGGIVMHFSFEGPNANVAASNYGVRFRNAAELRSTDTTHPLVKGVTFVTNHAVYTYGHFNSTNWKPAAILADSFNVLSRNWNDAGAAALSGCPGSLNRCATNSGTGNANVSGTNRNAANTDIYAAILSGTDTTGGTEGAGGQGGAYNGGLENYPRLHEDWGGDTLTYRGAFVSLNRPQHVNGGWVYGGRYYTAPTRNWDYDTRFNDAANLPPLTPRFVYLRQELFVRDFEDN